MSRFERFSRFDAPVDRVFEWHARPGALERLLPPWQDVRVLETSGGIEKGARVVVELRLGPLRSRWVAVHSEYERGRRFVDEQESGPFAAWSHEHVFVPEGEDTSVVEDHVTYKLPGGALVESVAQDAVQRTLRRMFEFRRSRIRRDLTRHGRHADGGRLCVAVSGASGLVGRQLCAFLTTGGHEVRRLVRRTQRPRAGDVTWDPANGEIDAGALEGTDAVIHLAGESIAGRWTVDRRRALRESRVAGTGLLARTLAGLARPPKVLISASAIGFYGETGHNVVDETAGPGDGFLAEICRDWEAAAAPAEVAGIRTVFLRTGIVLSPRGGALAKLLPPARLGLGGPVGPGDQLMSWVALDDVLGAIQHMLFTDTVAGPVNVTAPEPIANADFARMLGAVLGRPARLPLPAAAVRFALGEMGESLLLASQGVAPARLLESGFAFQFPSLESALRFQLGR